MRISYDWLLEYLDGDVPPAETLAEHLTNAGLEVEGLERPGAALAGVVVGTVRRVSPHPKADRLTVCEVDDGTATHTVVCGAPNVREGMRSAFAPAGVTLPNGLTLQARKVRGVPSEGMLCAEDELGLSDDHEGIVDLGDAAPGSPVSRAMGLDDTLLELGVTPNRPDALSHVGVARDAAAVLGIGLRLPSPALTEEGAAAASLASVRIDAPERCGRYAARVVEGVRVGPSPQWLQQRLRAAGVRAINNVVDVTNFVLMELGHPLHAFDLDRLGGRAIVVRRAGEGERMTTLDGVERTLDPDDLVIADDTVPVALAGVMGGADSEVGDGTTRILLESAWFEPTGVRRTAKRHGLHSEASHRFERGADPEAVVLACDRAAALIAELSGGRVRPGLLDVHPGTPPRAEVRLRHRRVAEILGLEVPLETQQGILRRLGFEAVGEEPDATVWRAPSFRTEMGREIDLVEEVARIHGLDDLPARLPPRPAEATGREAVDRERLVTERVRRAASTAGCHEVVNYSFVAASDVAAMLPAGSGERPEGRPIALANPLSAEQGVMRTTVLVSLLNDLRLNARHRELDVALYELGRAYLREDSGIREPLRLSAVLAGRRGLRSWAASDRPVDFYDAKGLVEAVFALLGLEGAFAHAPVAAPWLHPRSATEVSSGGRAIGWVGELHPLVARAFELPDGVFAVEIDLEPLMDQAVLTPAHRPVPRFPAVLRDLAVTVDAALPEAQVEAALREPTAEAERLGAQVTDVTLFDVYTGPQVGEGRKSLAFAIRYQAADRTLTDEDAVALHEALVRRLETTFSAELR